MSEERSYRRYRGSLTGPVILISLGLVFLLNNLGLMTGDVWDIILRLWPVILIAIGLDGILRREGLAGPALMIGLGTVFLLSNFGYLALNVWETIIRLWPVLLIAIGFDIVFGRRSIWGSLIGLVLILAILGGTLWYSGVRIERGQALVGQEITQTLEGASRAKVILEPGAGELRLHTLSEQDSLVAGRVATGRSQRVNKEFSSSGGQATLALRESGSVPVYFPGEGGRWVWDLGLNPSVPIDLDVHLGAGKADLDLTGLNLSRLNVEMGVGQAMVTLPESGNFRARVSGAIGQTIVVVPQGMAVRVNSDTGIASINVPGDYQRQGDTYTSPGYDTAEDRIDLDVGEAIGLIEIRGE